MSFRDIVVHVDGSGAGRGRAALAAQLAGRFDAHVTGFSLRTSLLATYYQDGAALGAPLVTPQSLIDAYREAQDQAADRARTTFAATAPAGSGWLELDGDTPAAAQACMRRADLTIFPRERLAGLAAEGLEPSHLAMSTGRPMLLTPDREPMTVGRRILVAWNGGRESARALHDAAPFLARAERVHVLSVGEDGASDRALTSHLERHGCRPDMIFTRGEKGQSAEEVLLDHVARLGCDLVVMGLYGHSRMREVLLGGVSRAMLACSPVPLFVSH